MHLLVAVPRRLAPRAPQSRALLVALVASQGVGLRVGGFGLGLGAGTTQAHGEGNPPRVGVWSRLGVRHLCVLGVCVGCAERNGERATGNGEG